MVTGVWILTLGKIEHCSMRISSQFPKVCLNIDESVTNLGFIDVSGMKPYALSLIVGKGIRAQIY